MSKIITEDGIVTGNVYNKYLSKNPIVKKMMAGFYDSVFSLIDFAKPSSVHEVGCGEGILSMLMSQKGYNVKSSDFSQKIIDIAKKNALNDNCNIQFNVRSIYDLEPEVDSADLIVCCEVLEHLEFPEKALSQLQSLNQSHLIFSVPREPVWRFLNLARLKYVTDLGNTPGHIQHWSKNEFVRLIGKYFTIEKVLSPFPWTMLICKK